MPNIVKELSLNKHPKDCKDLSLINARNIMVSNDFSCLQNELNITEHPTLQDYLEDKILVGYIPCNTEVVLFTVSNNDYNSLKSNKTAINSTITRYDEESNEFIECLDNFQYHGGKIVGTFTYNVQNNLIIAVAESDTITGDIVPLRSINLGKFDEETKGTDRELDAGLHAVSPELRIPKISDFSYIPGTTYKGWYYFFIRYKINNVDYTHWFPIGYPIFICDIEKQSIFKYGFRDNTVEKAYSISGAVDYFSTKSNVSKETVNLNIDDLDYRYKFYQIGFICVAKDSSKAFRSNDLDIEVLNFTVSIPEVNSCSVEELILDNFNYYNVKNIINYQNRLYISNFKEYNNPDISENELSKIRLTYLQEEVRIDDAAYQVISVDENGTIDSAENTSVDLSEYDIIEKNPYYNGTLIQSLKIGDEIKINLSNGRYTETGYIITKDGNRVPANLAINVVEDHGFIYTQYLIRFNITITIGDKTYFCAYRNKSNVSRTCEIIYNDFSEDIIIGEAGTILGTGPLFINTNESFNKRKKDSTLIPGEIYSFYIHFVNKYGESTDGYRIPNKVGTDEIQYITARISPRGFIKFPINQSVFGNDGNIYFSGDEEVHNNDGMSQESIVSFLNRQFDYLKNIPNSKWFQALNVSTDSIDKFIPFINDNGDILYKVPFMDFYFNGTTITYYNFKLKIDLGNFRIPDGYIGYYFSYEKFEPIKKSIGIITKRDASSQEPVTADNENQVKYDNYNSLDINNIDTVHFYSSNLDIDDNIDLDFNTLHVLKELTLQSNGAAYTTNSGIEIANARFPANLNMPEIGGYMINSLYAIDKVYLSIAGDALKDKRNLGTSIEIQSNKVVRLFDDNNSIYKAELIKLTTNIYTNENKILIKFTDIYYDYNSITINRGLNGHFTYNDFLVYDFNKFIFNSQNNVILNEKYGMYYKTNVFDVLENGVAYIAKYIKNFRAPLYYIQMPTYDTIFNEAKCFKNEPQIYYLQLEKTDSKVSSQIKQFAQNIIVLPENTVDLFENKYTTQDALNPKTFVNYDANKEYIDTYNKRVRRSNVIADESNENSWRVFPLEGYKDITENKGIITNIVGVGTTFLVHTEHSLFMFDRNNTLQTTDKEVQLAMPDIFDVDYKEVFTSDLGICGLQDRDAHIVDQFGYIFYDNDAHRIYKFGQGKIENIDLDIVQYLNKYKPYRVRFANDKESNRLLINIRFLTVKRNEQEITLSFNYVINKWISFHDYVFDAAFNTKQMLYYLINRYDDNLNITTDIYTINYMYNNKQSNLTTRNGLYARFENLRVVPEIPTASVSRIDIICNTQYDLIKYLEYIAYKLYRVKTNNKDNTMPMTPEEDEYLPTPVEEYKQPFSGNTLRVFNTEVDTNEIDILIDNETDDTKKNKSIMNYKKPWWELGNWNFNYLRDKKQGEVRFPTRLYGNYFIISFTFVSSYNRIEFESLDYQVTKDKI